MQILTFSLLCGLCDLLAPAGERDGLRRAVRLLCGLCVLCVMVAPLRQARDWLAGLDPRTWAQESEEQALSDYEKLMEEKLIAVNREQMQRALYELLDEQFGITREQASVTVDYDETEQTLTVRQVWVSLRGAALLCDPRRIEAAVTDAVDCPCTVSAG